MAAARGMLPLTNEDLLEVLVALVGDESDEVRAAATATIDTLDPESFAALAADQQTPPDVLDFLCLWPRAPHALVEAVVFNRTTSDSVLARLARESADAAIVEAVSLKQQSLIRSPEIIEAILANPVRTPEAERRALEVRAEFFEKQYGAQLVAEEQRVQAEVAARAEQEAARETLSIGSMEELMRLGLIDEAFDEIDDSLITDYEIEVGIFGPEPIAEEGPIDVEDLISAVEAEEGQITSDRMPVFQQVALMSIKERVMLAIKGSREARMILVRDPNRIVAGAVLRNPRITDTEVESIASIKTAPEDVLRQIGQNRAWTRSYVVIHNLVRNPRTPIAISLGFLNRIQTRDMRALSLNKNIPDVIRTTSARLYIKRSGA